MDGDGLSGALTALANRRALGEAAFVPCLVRSMHGSEVRALSLGHPLLDDYLAFVGARARVNTWLATAYDLKVFFTVVGKEPARVTAPDVFAFLKAQRAPRLGERVVRLEDGESGLAARTIARRLSSVSGLFAYLCARGDVGVARPRNSVTSASTRELDDPLRAEAGDVFEHHGKITIAVEQGVDLGTDRVNGRYCLRHGRRSPSSACWLRRNPRPSSFTPELGRDIPDYG